jgi:hypothetical protein
MKYICDILPKDKHSFSPRFNLNFLVPDGNISSPSDAPAATNYLQGGYPFFPAFLLSSQRFFFYIMPMQKSLPTILNSRFSPALLPLKGKKGS